MEISDPDYRPGRDYLSNGEIEATGKLIGGAVANICRELLERRKARKEGDTMQLTPEQLERAHVDVPRDLVERMICAFCSYDAGEHITYNAELFRKMTAALRVALKDPRVLGEPDDSETDDIVRVKLGFGPSGKVSPDFRYGAKLVLASRRARLLKPVRVQDRVEAFSTGHTWCVVVDKDRNHKDTRYNLPDEDLAQGYRLGLIAKMKAEGTVSREAGGNAQ